MLWLFAFALLEGMTRKVTEPITEIVEICDSRNDTIIYCIKTDEHEYECGAEALARAKIGEEDTITVYYYKDESTIDYITLSQETVDSYRVVESVKKNN